MTGSPHEALSALTRVFDALWRNAGTVLPRGKIPDFASLHPGYERNFVAFWRIHQHEWMVTAMAAIVHSIDHSPLRINLIFIVLFKPILDPAA